MSANNVYAATMTLDGSGYLGVAAQIEKATQLNQAALKRLDAQMALLQRTMRPVDVQAQAVRRQFDQVRIAASGLTTASLPATSALSGTTKALGGLGESSATVGLRGVAQLLSTITSQASAAGDALDGVGADAENVSGAVEGNAGQEKGQGEAHEGGEHAPTAPASGSFGLHQIESSTSLVVASAGQKLGPSGEVKELRNLEEIEKKTEAATEKLSETMEHLAESVSHSGEAAHTAGASHAAAGVALDHQAAGAHHAEEGVTRAGHAIEEAGHKSHRLAEEARDAGIGFHGLGEAAGKAGELVRDALIAMPEVAAVVGVFAGVGEAVKKIREAFTYGDQLNALSRQTGETSTTIAQLRRTFDYFDVSADAVGHTLFMLQRALGGTSEAGEPTAQAFNRIGLSIAQLKSMNAADQFGAIMLGLQKLPTQADRSAVAMKIFGRSAMEVQSILNASPADFAASMADAAEYAQVMGQNADAFEDVERKFFVFNEQIETLFARIAAGLLPAVQRLLDLVNRVDFSSWGRAITNVIGIMTNASWSSIGEMLKLTLVIGATDAMKTITGLFLGAAQGLNAALHSIFSGSLWTSLATGFKGVAEAFGAALIEQLRAPLNAIQSAISYVIDKRNAAVNVAADKKMLGEDAANVDRLHRRLVQDTVDLGPRDPQTKQDSGQLARAHEKYGDDAHQLSNDIDVSGLSLSDYQRKHANDESTLFGKSSAELQKQSSADLAGAAPAKTQFQGIIDAFMDGMKKADTSGMFNTSDLQKKLNDLITQSIPRTAVSGPASVAVTSRNTVPNMEYKRPEGDRLAKMGLFVGGSTASPGMSEARRTATATERTAKSVEQLLRSFPNHGRQPVPAYL